MRLRRSNSIAERHAAGDEPARDRQPEPHDRGDERRAGRSAAGRSRRRRSTPSMARPVSHGIATVRDHRQRRQRERPDRACAVGPEEPEQAQEGAHATTGYGRAGRSGIFARARMTDAIALRNRFAMVKGAWDDHLRGVPFPALGEGTAEEKIERLELALVDEMRAPGDARDGRAGGRRDVGARARPAGDGPRQAAGDPAPRGAGPAGPSPDLSGSWPRQVSTGSRGYSGTRVVRARRHIENAEPRCCAISSLVRQLAQSPAASALELALAPSSTRRRVRVLALLERRLEQVRARQRVDPLRLGRAS